MIAQDTNLLQYMRIWICFLTVIVTINGLIYTKQMLQTTDALCLDGSAPAFYVAHGDPSRILLHFESGGWCGGITTVQALQDCYQRSLTDLGSSKKLPQTMKFTYGILSDSNPNFFTNWTKIFLPYCDGSGHQGGSNDSIRYKDTQLFFRGSLITIQRFDYLEKKYGLYSKATEVVLSGASAGGLAVFTWGNYLGERVKTDKYWLISDSGIFIDSPNYINNQNQYKISFQYLFKLSNQQIDPPTPQCLKKFPEEKYMCMFADHLIEHIRYPLFVVQSLYDSWSIANILGMECALDNQLLKCDQSERLFIEQYRKNTSNIIDKVKKISVVNGYWANGCVYHGYTFFGSYNSPKYRIPSGSEFSIDFGIQQWMTSEKNTYYEDLEEWPANTKCSNMPKIDSIYTPNLEVTR